MGLIGATKRLAVVCRASYFRPGGRCQAVLLTISLASTFLMTAIPQAVADERPPISQLSSSSHHHALEKHAGQSDTDQASTLSGTLVDSLGNKLPGANVEVVPAGSSGCGSPVIASTNRGGRFVQPLRQPGHLQHSHQLLRGRDRSAIRALHSKC